MNKVKLILLIVVIVFTLITSTTATVGNQPATRRIAGADRYHTSALISQENFPAGADTVYVANGETLIDALTVAPVADGPVLLVSRNDVSGYVLSEIDRLNPEHIVILGGKNSISDYVVDQLNAVAHGDTDIQAYMLQRINEERGSNLVLASDLNAIAYDWSQQMAQNRTMEHNPTYTRACCWRGMGENVGWTTLLGTESHYLIEGIDRLHTGFMNSPHHRDNIINPAYDDVGLGIYVSDRCPDGVGHPYCMWVAQNFRNRNDV